MGRILQQTDVIMVYRKEKLRVNSIFYMRRGRGDE
jgi:hypothetical protein